jgi:hypothetical protein
MVEAAGVEPAPSDHSRRTEAAGPVDAQNARPRGPWKTAQTDPGFPPLPQALLLIEDAKEARKIQAGGALGSEE